MPDRNAPEDGANPQNPDDAPGKSRPTGFDARLKAAQDREAARRAADEALEAKAVAGRATASAWRIMFDLVVATTVVAALGYGVDAALGWSPFGLLAGLFLGFAIGMWMAVRTAAALQRQAQPPAESPRGGDHV
jgi:ATP synthase protein I